MIPPNPIAAMAELLAAFVPAPFSPETLERHVATRAHTSVCAAQAVGALRLFVQALEAGSLQRLAVGYENASADLADLASAAMRARDALDAERRAAAQVLREDAAGRVVHDGAVMTLMHLAMGDAKHAAGLARQAAEDAARLPETLAAAGLSEAEIRAVLDARQGCLHEAGQRHREASHAAQARVEALEGFLRDPLRRLDRLAPALVTEIVARSNSQAGRAAVPLVTVAQTQPESSLTDAAL